MHTSATDSPRDHQGFGAYLAALIAAMVLLAGAATAQAAPSDKPADFIFDLQAASASFTPAADEPGMYRLELQGVRPNSIGIFELTATEYSTSLGLPQLMAYWTRYGDETGQFVTNPPRAVLRVADGAAEEVVVRLRNGSNEGSTLRFDAEIITSPRVWGVLEKKVDQVDETAAQVEHTHELEPTTMENVEMFIDMPARITQPDAPTAKAANAGATSMLRAAPSTRSMTCNGVRSSRLVRCWNEIGTYGQPAWSIDPPAPYIAFNQVGLVDLGSYWFSPAVYIPLYAQMPFRYVYPFDIDWIIGRDTTRHFVYWSGGEYFGVSPRAETLFVSSRCTWFMERWHRNGPCW
jgi:hypothetical protein